MRRRAVVAVLVAAAAAGLAAVLTRTNAAQASSLDEVVAQVRTSFGDNRIVRARIDGSTLHVVLATPPSGWGQTKSRLETHVLAAAVAEWMRSHGVASITAVGYANLRGDVLSEINAPLDGEPVSINAGVSSPRPGRCRSVAARSVRGFWPPLTLVSVEELPYLHGTCVFRFRTSEEPIYATGAAPEVLLRVARGLGDPDQEHRPWFFELDGPHGKPLVSSGRIPGLGFGSNWARRGPGDPFVHG